MIYKLRTVDIWDTVFRRKCHPDAVKLETARKLATRHSAILHPHFRNSWKLLELRCRVEGQLARASALNAERDDEYTLQQVLSEWIGQAGVSDNCAAGRLACGLGTEELEHEDFVCYVDGGIREKLANYPAEKTAFLSDFYMPASSIFFLLNRKGIAEMFDAGHTSCDHGLNKRSGRLFKFVQALYQVEPHEHLHIGDNPSSDYQIPKQLGMAAVLYQSESEERLQKTARKTFYSRRDLYSEIDRQCVAGVPHFADDAQKAAYRYGVKLAPLFAAFGLFILESVERNQPQKLFFFTREGEFFIKAYAALRNACPRRGHALPEAKLLEVSRMATFAASLREISTTEMMRLWTLYSTQSLRAWGQSLGLDPLQVSAWCKRYGIDHAAPVRYPWLDERVQKLFQDPEIKLTLEGFVREKRLLLLDFLESHGLSIADRKVAVVDIGWRGSIQDNLALVMPETFFSGIYLGLQAFLNPQPVNCDKSAFGADLNKSADDSALFGNLPLVEMLTNSPYGSVTGYQRDSDGSVKSLRLLEEGENVVFRELVATIQQGALHGVRTWAEHIHAHAVSSGELRELGLNIWRTAVEDPPKFVSKALSRLNHNELFGAGTFERPKQRRAPLLRLFRPR